MTLSDLATSPEINVASQVLMRLLFQPKQFVQEAEVVLSEDHDDPHKDCGRGQPPPGLGKVCFYRAILKIQVPDAGTVVYRINAYDPENDTWTAAWPD